MAPIADSVLVVAGTTTRLDMDELEERLGAVYGAKTAPELVEALVGLRAAQPPMWSS
jgi:hypothetical protein